MSLENESDRLELYKNCILAFEKLRYRNELSKLDSLDDASQLDVIGSAFASIDEIEAAQYGEIARGRIRVIEAFKGLVDSDAREKVVQNHLFDHLWLLDTSWERAATNTHVEERVTTDFDKITDSLTPEEKAGRIDIRYRTAAGKHIIIELKRYGVRVTVGDLLDQLGKYHTALRKCLDDHFPELAHEIECIAVLGEPPHNVSPDQVRQSLAGIGARVVTYDDLIRTALDSYEEYLAAHAEVSQLANLIDRLEKSADDAPDGDGSPA